MTPWELAACVHGWNAVHGAEEAPPVMTDEEERALIDSVAHLLL